MKKGARSQAKRRGKSGGRAWTWIWLAIVVVVGFGVSQVAKRSSQKGGTPKAAESTPSDAEKDRALRSEQLQAAEQLLALYSSNDDAVYLAGLIYNDQGNSEQAMKLWTRSIELDATRADANESLGYALLLRDDYKGAEKHFRRALEINTNSHTARFRLASALSQDGQLQEALEVLEEEPQLSAEGHRLMADAARQLGQFPKAKDNYEAALRLSPNSAEACYGLSQALAQLGDTEKSKEFLARSSALRKENDDAARRARADFNSLAVTRRSVAQTHTDAGRVYGSTGNIRKAEELWRRAAAIDPQNLLCRVQLAVLCHQSKRYREAFEFYEEAIKLDPTDGLAQLNLGNVCLKLNLPDRAEEAFREVIRLEPNRAEGHSALARLYLQTNRNLPEAERLAAAAVNLEPEARYFAVLAEARAKNGNLAGALNAIDRAIALEPANPQHAQTRQQLLGRK